MVATAKARAQRLATVAPAEPAAAVEWAIDSPSRNPAPTAHKAPEKHPTPRPQRAPVQPPALAVPQKATATQRATAAQSPALAVPQRATPTQQPTRRHPNDDNEFAQEHTDANIMMPELAAVGQSMTGDLTEVPLVQLLTLFATNKKTGILEVACRTGAGPTYQARLVLEEGALIEAHLPALPHLSMHHALARLVAQAAGTFDFQAHATTSQKAPTGLTEELLEEAVKMGQRSQRITPPAPPNTQWLRP